MAVTVETLEKLERKITLSVPVTLIQAEVDSRLKRLARTVKMDGFRPGKVPMNVVAQRYGYSVQYEVLNDKVGEAFAVAANEAKLRVAGQPRITEKEGAPEGQVTFDAVFEVFPEVKIADLSDAEVEKLSAEVTDAAIDKTIDILRKQRRSFAQRNRGMTRVLIGDALVNENERLQARINLLHDKIEAAIKQALRVAATQEQLGADADFGALANALLCYVVGRWHQYAKSGFAREPMAQWKAQWPMLYVTCLSQRSE